MAITQQQGIDLATSFGPSLLASLVGGGNKIDKQARARNDLANLLEVQQNAALQGANLSGNQLDALRQMFGDYQSTRTAQGNTLLDSARLPGQLMQDSQQARIRAALLPQVAGILKVPNINLPPGTFDIYNRMGSDDFLAQQLNQFGEGKSLAAPLSSTYNMGSAVGPEAARAYQPNLNSFADAQRSGFQNQERGYQEGVGKYSTALDDAIAGYKGAATDYQTGLQGLQKQEQSSGGGGLWKKLLGLGAMAAIPFTGGLSGLLAGATGLGSAASAGLVGAGLGAAGAVGSGSNPLMGAILGGATGGLIGPGGKFGTALKPSIPGTTTGLPTGILGGQIPNSVPKPSVLTTMPKLYPTSQPFMPQGPFSGSRAALARR